MQSCLGSLLFFLLAAFIIVNNHKYLLSPRECRANSERIAGNHSDRNLQLLNYATRLALLEQALGISYFWYLPTYLMARKTSQSGVCLRRGVQRWLMTPGISAFLPRNILRKARLTSFSGGIETVRLTARRRSLGARPKRAVSTAPGVITVIFTPCGWSSYHSDLEKL